MIYLSRNYTEFGPFSNAELLDFCGRGILQKGDHFRAHGADVWWSFEEWEVLAREEGLVVKGGVGKKAKKVVKRVAKKVVVKKSA